ncbi:MAG: hypothetical protein ACTSU4_08155 [Promethearchaeota archaeon]
MSEKDPFIYNNVKLGRGNFELPPVLIGTIFYQGETIVDRMNPSQFNDEKAKKRIKQHFELSEKYHLPGLIEISGDTPESIERYLSFYLDNFETPFVLGGTFEARMAGIQYLKERGIKPMDYIYNTISNLKNPKELEVIRENKINSIVILIVGSENMTSTQRFNYITKKDESTGQSLIQGVQKLGVERIWIDGGVVNLESLAHILEFQRLVSTSLYLPVGTAPTLFLFKYSSPRLNVKFHTKFRKASIMFIASWFSNFIFYGAIEDAKECFASAYQAHEFKKVVREHNINLID